MVCSKPVTGGLNLSEQSLELPLGWFFVFKENLIYIKKIDF